MKTLQLIGPCRQLNQEERPSVVVSILVELEHLALELLDERLVDCVGIFKVTAFIRALSYEVDFVDAITFLSEHADIELFRVTVAVRLGAEHLNDVTLKLDMISELLSDHIVERENVPMRYKDVGVHEHKALKELAVGLDPLVEDTLNPVLLNGAGISDRHSRLVLVADALDESGLSVRVGLLLRVVLLYEDRIERDVHLNGRICLAYRALASYYLPLAGVAHSTPS